MERPRYLQLLELLHQRQVSFIIVGGVAAILEGAPVTTLDLDLVYDRSPENLVRLLKVLEAIEARYRDPAGRHIVPDFDKLASIRVNLLKTRLGPLDLLASVAESKFEELLEFTVLRRVKGMAFRVLTLEKIIESKELANRDKDRAMLPVLRKTLEIRNQR